MQIRIDTFVNRSPISRSRAPETTSWYVSSSTWANFNTRHDREQLIQSKQFKAVWSHVTERNSPMHLRQEKQETYHTQTRGKAQHNSCIKHIPTQHSHLIVLSTWGAGCNARARGRPHARTFINQRTNHCWRRQFSQQSGPTLLGNILLCALGKGARDASYPNSGAQPGTVHTSSTFQRST